MKANKYMATLVASLAVAFAPSAMADVDLTGATLLAGWYAFETGAGAETGDVVDVLLADAYVTESTTSNIGINSGCADTFYGSSNISAPSGGIGNLNGSATITNVATVFSLINGGTKPLYMGFLLFDARKADASPGQPKLTVTYAITGGPSGNVATNIPSSGILALTNDYTDFDFDLQGLGLIVPVGGKIDFGFTAAGSNFARLDNIGITLGSPIPEPGSMLALGCFLGSGLLIRRNRRSVA